MSEGDQRQVRGEKVVAKVLEATLEELAAKGYNAASIEDVAVRAGVAKTTIYRRWPTKADLVLAAIHRVADDIVNPRVAGSSLRDDLVSILCSFRDVASSPRGGSLMRMMLAEGAHGEVAAVARSIRKTKEALPRAFVERAIKRGELPAGSNAQLIFDLLFGAVQHYVLFVAEPCDDRKIEQLVDLVLVGAHRGGACPAT
jgi:AcrR family transcriptional regulator